ncbi:MAG: DUF1573 domain-containing protein [Flavobacteriales bacterium]|nr:DUF1573 domain-containing protein [Flavobacteriales bacterium]MCB9203425.1 DUF1573 domain-containing protein [Flavobacteriales bacterium]
MKKIAFVLISAMALYSCGGENASEKEASLDTDVVANPATAETESGTADNVDVPEFSFEKEVHDFGTIVQGEKVAYSFKFKNTGKGDLIITSAKGSCGCTVPEWPQEPIAPGAEGVIDVVFNSDGKSGQQNKKVTIVANTVPNTKVLAINGMVEVPVEE